jgi:hypothetical protein
VRDSRRLSPSAASASDINGACSEGATMPPGTADGLRYPTSPGFSAGLMTSFFFSTAMSLSVRSEKSTVCKHT